MSQTYMQETLRTTGNWLRGELVQSDQARAMFPQRHLRAFLNATPSKFWDAIESPQEYRTALITAVTDKIDSRYFFR